MRRMITRIAISALFGAAVVPFSVAADAPISIAPAPADSLAQYTEPLQKMFDIVEEINAMLASAQDEDSAEAAGEAIQPKLRPLEQAALSFSSLPQPSPEEQEKINTWFAEREHIMQEMVDQVERLNNADPAFYGSQTLIASIVMLGGVLGGTAE